MEEKDCTIRIVPEERCTGCGACCNRCPAQAISMEYNAEGFRFPHVKEDACTQCGACRRACPELRMDCVKVRMRPHMACYAAMAEDDAIRMASSSGGLFTLLAEQVYARDGMVCGAVYRDDWQEVYHIASRRPEDLPRLRGSKYVQSDTRMVYREIEESLRGNLPVLFCGCPCQVAGLYTFLGKEYANLYTVDLVCHGANSVFAYQSYLKETAKGKKIQSVNFRDKSVFGWSTPTAIYYQDGTAYHAAWDKSKWNEGFLGGIINRKCCGSCHYAQAQRIGDVSLGDFWQVARWDWSCDDGKGTSLVLVNTAQGDHLYRQTIARLQLNKAAPLDFAAKYNGQLRSPASMAPGRRFFFSHLPSKGYHQALWYGHRWHYDVGLVGWWFAANYGSVLTYYSLGKLIEERDMLPIMLRVPNFYSTAWEPVTEQNIRFMEQHFIVSKPRQFKDMGECNKFCDAFMVGSDQLWVQDYCNLLGYTFFLDFVDGKHKKLAYATSLGHAEYKATPEEKKIAGMLLRRFDGISVREDSGVSICRRDFGVEAVRCLDPVFLCDTKYYDALAEKAVLDEKTISIVRAQPYLFCYLLDLTEEKRQGIRLLEKKLGMASAVVLDLKKQASDRLTWEGENIPEHVGVEEFVHLVKHCGYVYTDSHHGVCFGMIYHKPFAAISNPRRGKARFTSLFHVFAMEYLLIEEGEILKKLPEIPLPDYVHIDRVMAAEKQRALEWLDAHLRKDAGKHDNPTEEDLFARYFHRSMVAEHSGA